MEHFWMSFGVAIILSFVYWVQKRPAKKQSGGGIVLQHNKAVCIVFLLPALGMLFLAPIIINEFGFSSELFSYIGIFTFFVILPVGLFLFLNRERVFADNEGVMEQKGKNQKFLGWSDIKKVEYVRLKGWIKLLGDDTYVTINLGMVGGCDFLNMIEQKLPPVLYGEVINEAKRRIVKG